jgi:hypothetical protein
MATKKAPEEVAGIKVAKVNGLVLTKHMLKAGLSIDGSLVELIERMSEHIREKGGELADCDVCGGECDVAVYTVCPYCGVGEEEESAGKPKAPYKDSAKVEKLDDDKAAAPEKPKAEKGLRKRASQKPPDDGKPAAKVTALAKPKADPEAAKKLDEAVKTVKEVRDRIDSTTQSFGKAVMGDHWDLGKALYAIFKDDLYTQRVDAATGVPRYKSWNQFVIGELGMSAQQAYKLMNVSLAFTRKQVEEYGVSKLKHLVRLPEAERNAMLEDAAKRLPESELAKEVRERAAKSGASATTAADRKRAVKPTAGGGRKGSKAAAAKVKPRPLQDKVTIAALLTRQTVPLFVKGSVDKRAKRIGDEPTGREEMLNGVVCTYKLAMHASGLVLIVERKREAV